jgi:hypothetical protein
MDLAGRPEVFHALLVLGGRLVAGLAVALRALRRRVALDEAEEVLRAEYEECDRGEIPRSSGTRGRATGAP